MGLPVDMEGVGEYLDITPVATYFLLAANTLVFLGVSILFPFLGFRTYDDLLFAYGIYPADILSFETFYRVFTSMFLHAGIFHLFGNMFFLYMFGRSVEKVMGTLRFLLFYVLSGIIAVLFHTLSIVAASYAFPGFQLTHPEYWLIPSVGASGAISGVLGACLVLYPRAKLITMFYFFPVLMTVEAYIVIWFLFQVFMGMTYGVSAGVAFWAHLGGFIGGISLLPLFVRKEIIAVLRQKRLLMQIYGIV